MLPSFIGICHVGGGGGCPAEGTVLYNARVTYPIAEGGAYVTVYGTDCPTQDCDVNTVADGACGQYIDWTSKSNIGYKPIGTFLNSGGVASVLVGNEYSNNSQFADTGSASVVLNGTTYYTKRFNNWVAESDGAGGCTFVYSGGGENWPAGFHYTNVNLQTEVPSGSSNFYDNGTYQYWKQNGDDTVYDLLGSCNMAGGLISENITGSASPVEVPTGSGNNFDSQNTGDRYEWDGSCGYNYLTSWYKPYGTFITTDSGTDYFWDGAGGYYS